MATARRVVAALLALGCGSVGAAGLEGRWLTEDRDAHVHVGPCVDAAAALCGTLVWLEDPDAAAGRPWRDVHNPEKALNDRALLGLEIMRISATPDRNGMYRDGTLYDPKSGKTYRCKAALEERDRVRLRGFVGIALFGRTTYWQRVEGLQPNDD